MDHVFGDGLADALSQVADPDLALLGLVRLMESLGKRDVKTSDHGEDRGEELIAALRHDGPGCDRLLAVLGASTALVDHLVTHPAHWRYVTDATRQSAEQRRDALVGAVTMAMAMAKTKGKTATKTATKTVTKTSAQSAADTSIGVDVMSGYDALRVAYRSNLLGIAALDLTAQKAVDELPPTAAALADLAAAALEAALVIARAEVGPEVDICRFAVIGMGKCGGRELNYVSDVDVIFVAEPASGDAADETAAFNVGTQMATALMLSLIHIS